MSTYAKKILIDFLKAWMCTQGKWQSLSSGLESLVAAKLIYCYNSLTNESVTPAFLSFVRKSA